jgi:hypothetical protein
MSHLEWCQILKKYLQMLHLYKFLLCAEKYQYGGRCEHLRLFSKGMRRFTGLDTNHSKFYVSYLWCSFYGGDCGCWDNYGMQIQKTCTVHSSDGSIHYSGSLHPIHRLMQCGEDKKCMIHTLCYQVLCLSFRCDVKLNARTLRHWNCVHLMHGGLQRCVAVRQHMTLFAQKLKKRCADKSAAVAAWTKLKAMSKLIAIYLYQTNAQTHNTVFQWPFKLIISI